MSNYIKITDDNGNIKVVDYNYRTNDNVVQDNNSTPDLWTYCDVSYKDSSFSIRSKRFEGKKKVEIYDNGSWIVLAIDDEPDLSNLIINFYNNSKK